MMRYKRTSVESDSSGCEVLELLSERLILSQRLFPGTREVGCGKVSCEGGAVETRGREQGRLLVIGVLYSCRRQTRIY